MDEDRALSVGRLFHQGLKKVNIRDPLTPGVPRWEYERSRENPDLAAIRPSYGLWIGGKEVEPLSEKWFATIEPATEEHLATVAEAGPADIDRAVEAARSAAPAWAALARGGPGQVPVPYRPADPGT